MNADRAPFDRVLGLFAGTVRPMPGDGRPTAIFKQPLTAAVHLSRLGLRGDEQGDPRVHGGPDKALHQYPRAHYTRLAERFPECAAAFVPGAMGENLSTADLGPEEACIGDVYQLGDQVRIQLCQPRRPCWKIDTRFGLDGISAYVADQGLTGWYYRVLRGGPVQVGDPMRLIQRTPGALTLAGFLRLNREHRPDPQALLRAAALPGLNTDWMLRLRDRAAWLRDHVPPGGPPARS